MLFASAKAASPAAARTDDAPAAGPASSSSDAHRSFCDLFEEERVVYCEAPLAAAAAPGPDHYDVTEDEASATAAAAGPTSTESSTANKTGGSAGGRTPGAGAGAGAASTSFFEDAAASVRRGLVGRNAPFRTPYGMKPLVYSDWTATGRAVDSIEVHSIAVKLVQVYLHRLRSTQ